MTPAGLPVGAGNANKATIPPLPTFTPSPATAPQAKTPSGPIPLSAMPGGVLQATPRPTPNTLPSTPPVLAPTRTAAASAAPPSLPVQAPAVPPKASTLPETSKGAEAKRVQTGKKALKNGPKNALAAKKAKGKSKSKPKELKTLNASKDRAAKGKPKVKAKTKPHAKKKKSAARAAALLRGA